MKHCQPRTLGAVAILAGALVVAGCQGQDAASYVKSAQTYIAKADYKSAIIEVKNALQKDPNNAEARLVLGQALLESGDPVGAETELRKALDAGMTRDRAWPLLARALVVQGQFAKATKELDATRLDDPKARLALSVDLAVAQAGQGNVDQARADVKRILTEDPNNIRALLLDAQFAGQSGDLDTVRHNLDAALRVDPSSLDALLMKAELELATMHRDEAQKVMEQAIAAHPDSIAARGALVSLAVTSGKLDLAKTQLAKMKELQPKEIRTIYSEALVAFAEGDNSTARASLQRLLASRPDHLPSLELSGLVDLQLGTYASAEETLQRVLNRVPQDVVARRGLAIVYLRTGRALQALDLLKPALAQRPDDPVLLRTSAEAYLAAGNAEQAMRDYERANAIDKNNVASQVRLAQVRFATGDTARAFNDLEAISSSEAKIGQADLALFAAHLKRREYDKALALVDTLEKKAPKSALPWNLRGTVYVTMRDLEKARASYEKALELQPDYAAAAASLAAIDIQEGNLKAARDRYDKLLAKNPKNEQLLLGAAEILRMSGAPSTQVRAAFERAVSANPGSVRSRVALIGYDVSIGDTKGAMTAAQSAIAAIPKDPQLLEALANVSLMNGDANQAVDTLKQLVVLQPQNPAAMLRLANAQAVTKDYRGALESVRKALLLKPDLGPAWGTMAKIYLAAGQPDAALAEAKKLQKDLPGKAIGYALEGEVLLAERKPQEAIVAFREAVAKEPSAAVAARLYQVLEGSGRQADASAMAEQWIKDHPKDVALLQLTAQSSQQKKAYGDAIEGYKRVLEIDPDNIVALNNLAWIMIERNDPKGVEYAERAHRLAPFSPNVLDTLGWARTRTGDPKRGAELLRMASSLAPNAGEIRMHLAKALLDAGDKPGARAVLTDLTKLDNDSPLRAEAEKLLATL
jgi:putative PEP-CTERM system TPR-repeat lipoprotein